MSDIHRRNTRRALQAIALSALTAITTALFAPGPAWAGVTIVPASACFNGEAGPRDLVASSNGPTFFSNVSLFCGDPTKGVIHIDAEHPINANGSDDANVRNCHHNVMHRGSEVPANPGNRAWQITRPGGGSATVVFDANTLETITMFTSDSNNWAACAAYPN